MTTAGTVQTCFFQFDDNLCGLVRDMWYGPILKILLFSFGSTYHLLGTSVMLIYKITPSATIKPKMHKTGCPYLIGVTGCEKRITVKVCLFLLLVSGIACRSRVASEGK
jgi:hypothetical protein